MFVAVLSGCYKLAELSILYDIDVADYRDKNRFINVEGESLDFNTFGLGASYNHSAFSSFFSTLGAEFYYLFSDISYIPLPNARNILSIG